MILPDKLLNAYASGIFPMADSRHDPEAKWYTSRRRGIIPLNHFKVSSNVRRIIRNRHYHIKIDEHFKKVMQACANRKTTWISDEIIESYVVLHKLGHAHSVSVYNQDSELVGGQYGVSLGVAYFGASVVGRVTEAGEVDLYWTHRALLQGCVILCYTQFWTRH